MLIDLNWNYEW